MWLSHMTELRDKHKPLAQCFDHMRKMFPNSKVGLKALIERNPDGTFTEHGKVTDEMRRTALDSWSETEPVDDREESQHE